MFQAPPNRSKYRVPFARSLFVIAALLPTCGTLGAAAYLRIHDGPEAWTRWLAHAAGVKVTIGKWTRPRPGCHRAVDVKLFDLSRGHYFGRISELELCQQTQQVGLRLREIELQRGEAFRFLRLLHDRLFTRPDLWDRTIRVEAERWQLADAVRVVELFQLQGVISNDDKQRTAHWMARRNQGASAAPFEITLHRENSPAEPTTRLRILAEDTLLPGELLFPIERLEPWLGTAATFQGEAWYELNEEGLSGEWIGRVHEVDLAKLGAKALDLELRGRATARVIQARWEAGRLCNLDAILDTDLLTASGQALETLRHRMQQSLPESITGQPEWQKLTHRIPHWKCRLRYGDTRRRFHVVPIDEP